MAAPVKIFFAYSPKDRKFVKELEKHLSSLQRYGLITMWDSEMVPAGAPWESEIEKHISTSHIILLLISPDFLASNFYNTIITKAMQMQKTQEAKVIPVLLRPIRWQEEPFRDLQALPRNAIPVSRWSQKDVPLLDIAQEIRQAVEREADRPVPPISASVTAKTSPEEERILVGELEQAATDLRESYSNLRSYESIIRFTDDPAERARILKAAEKQRILAKHYSNDYVETAYKLGMNIPAEIAQMSAYLDNGGLQVTN